jgi:hypothetical protein
MTLKNISGRVFHIILMKVMTLLDADFVAIAFFRTHVGPSTSWTPWASDSVVSFDFKNRPLPN